MKWKRIEADFSLHDPESSFTFSRRGADVAVSFRDWRNQRIVITFAEVAKFAYSWLPPCPELPDEAFYEADDSDYVNQLVETVLLGEDEEMHHYLIATNEDEWCEVVADTYNVEIE